MSWQKPIFDRNQDDVYKVYDLNNKIRLGTATDEEKQEWASDLKGAFNKSDMERIVNNISELKNILSVDLTVPTVQEFPTSSWFNSVLQATEKLRSSALIHQDTPAVPSIPINIYDKVNDIEKILFDIYDIFNNKFYHYCGEGYYSGDEISLLL